MKSKLAALFFALALLGGTALANVTQRASSTRSTDRSNLKYGCFGLLLSSVWVGAVAKNHYTEHAPLIKGALTRGN